MALLSDKINGVKTIIGLQSPAKAGFLQSYGGVTAPSGWLACDGTAVSRTTYSQLFANIGTKYGVGDGSTTFNLPSGPSSTYEVDNSVLDVVTASSALTGKVIGVTAISAISYQDSNGKHWLRFAGEVTTASSITGRMKFTGVDMGVDAAGISAADVAGALAMKISAKEKTVNNLFWSLVSGTGTIWGVSGDISIVSKPDWHDANIESTTIIKSFNDEAKGVTVGIAPATESESGTVTLSQLSSGTTNYVTNGDFEASITTGVSLTTLDSSSETVAPLFDTTSLKLTSQASAGVADFEIAGIDNGVIEAGVSTQVSAYLKTDSAVAEGDWTVGVYNVTDASYATSQTDLKVDSINIHRTPFVPLAAKVYVLRVEFVDTIATRDLVVDKIVMTPDSNSGLVPASPDSEIKVNIATGWGSVGTRIRTWTGGNVSTTGNGITYTPSASNSDNGDKFTINESGVYALTYSEDDGVGFGFSKNSTAVTTSILGLSEADGYIAGDYQGGGGGTFGTASATLRLEAGDWIYAHGDAAAGGANEQTRFTITQVSKDNKVNLLTQEVVGANDRSKWICSTIATGAAGTPMDFDTVHPDFTNVGTWANTNGVITIPADGDYQVNLAIKVTNALAPSTEFYVEIDGVSKSVIAMGDVHGSALSQIKGSDVVSISAGQTLEITSDDAGGFNCELTSFKTYLSIIRVNEYGAFDPIGFALATANQAGLVYKPQVLQKHIDVFFTAGAIDQGQVNNVPGGRYRVTIGCKQMNAFAGENCAIYPRLNDADIIQDSNDQWFLGFNVNNSTKIRDHGKESSVMLTFPNTLNTFDIDIVMGASSEIYRVWYILERLDDTFIEITTEWD